MFLLRKTDNFFYFFLIGPREAKFKINETSKSKVRDNTVRRTHPGRETEKRGKSTKWKEQEKGYRRKPEK